jgi:transposase
MSRYKTIDTSPRFLAVDLQRQLVAGTFEHALDWLVDHELDLTGFDVRYRNDANGAPAYPPALLLKVVLFAYSRGMVSSRQIDAACRENVTFIALSGDHGPHFTTIAHFVSTLGDEIAPLFARVLYLCGQQGLIGREMFAIDGVKLPANASKAKSGTRTEFVERATKLEAEVKKMVARHREQDTQPEPSLDKKAAKRLERLQRDAKQIRDWLALHPNERQGSRGTIRKSNLTDNESAKMATSKGVIQGYCGVAAVDAKHQIIIDAQAHGTGSEQSLLIPVIEAISPLLVKGESGQGADGTVGTDTHTLITADAGYHSEANLAALDAMNINALIADNGMRQRDERFADQLKHKAKPDPLHDKRKPKPDGLFRPHDFSHDPVANTCICPAGQSLYSNGKHCAVNGRTHHKFQGSQTSCVPCALRAKCLRHPDQTKTRQVAFFDKHQASPLAHTQRMKERIDSDEGKRLYGQRFATVEPVFGNIRHNKRLNRFTLRGQQKVDGQWKLFCMVHNIEKLANHGFAMPPAVVETARKRRNLNA